jgi:photosystem II stability/assembly factor-like uncharacterized protein
VRWLLPLILTLLAAACVTPRVAFDLQLQELSAPTPASLRGVCAVSANTLWVSGSDGTCLRSLDGGTTWQDCAPELTRGRDLRDVHAFGALHAVVMAVGSPALLLRTEDGGATWREVWRHDHPQAFLDGIDFSDAENGYAVGDPIAGRFVTLRTRDGGASWEPTAPAPNPLPGEAAFAASGTCLCAVSGGAVLVATGGGEVARVLRGEARGSRWRTHTTPLRSGTPSRGAFSLAVHGARAIAVGGDYRAPAVAFANIAVSDDGGRSWGKPAGTPPRGYRSAVAFVPGTRGRVVVAAGETGVDVSHDGGDNWQALSDNGYHALSFAPDGTGYAVGADGRIAKLIGAR